MGHKPESTRRRRRVDERNECAWQPGPRSLKIFPLVEMKEEVQLSRRAGGLIIRDVDKDDDKCLMR